MLIKRDETMEKLSKVDGKIIDILDYAGVSLQKNGIFYPTLPFIFSIMTILSSIGIIAAFTVTKQYYGTIFSIILFLAIFTNHQEFMVGFETKDMFDFKSYMKKHKFYLQHWFIQRNEPRRIIWRLILIPSFFIINLILIKNNIEDQSTYLNNILIGILLISEILYSYACTMTPYTMPPQKKTKWAAA